MNEKREDRRVVYTKIFLKESLLDLMKEKPISKITTAELCRHANINRNTFYSHYNSPEDLLRSIEDDLYEEIKQSLGQTLIKGNIPAFLLEICEAIYRHGDLCKIILSDYGDKVFLKRVLDQAHDRSIALWKSNRANVISEEHFEFFYTFSASGSIAVIQQWIQDGMKCSPEEIASFIGNLLMNMTRNFRHKLEALSDKPK